MLSIDFPTKQVKIVVVKIVVLTTTIEIGQKILHIPLLKFDTASRRRKIQGNRRRKLMLIVNSAKKQ